MFCLLALSKWFLLKQFVSKVIVSNESTKSAYLRKRSVSVNNIMPLDIVPVTTKSASGQHTWPLLCSALFTLMNASSIHVFTFLMMTSIAVLYIYMSLLWITSCNFTLVYNIHGLIIIINLKHTLLLFHYFLICVVLK